MHQETTSQTIKWMRGVGRFVPVSYLPWMIGSSLGRHHFGHQISVPESAVQLSLTSNPHTFKADLNSKESLCKKMHF
jgi:hypothetical protein